MPESPQTQPEILTLAPGEKLEQYEVIEQVGAGGSSIVWKCYDAVSDREVAIKQLLLSGTPEDDSLAQRFRQEAQMLRNLTEAHPRLVKLYDFIDDGRGVFLVTEFIEGKTLEQELAASPEPLEPLRALKIIHSTANVLTSIHEQNVIHRDLKPSNLMLPEGGGLKVCDLGLATIMAEQEALPVGSVRYMAPELFTGDQAGPAADIYALGMIAYEMLAGREAFDRAFRTVLRDRRNQAMRWMKWHTNFRSKPPPLTDLNPKLTPRLSDLVARMMHKDIDRRIHSAEELNQTINRHFSKQGQAVGPAVPVGDEQGSMAGPAGMTSPPELASPNSQIPNPQQNQTSTFEKTANPPNPRTTKPPESQTATDQTTTAPGDTASLPKPHRWPIYLGGAMLVIVLGIGLAFYARHQAVRSALIDRAVTQTRTHLDNGQSFYQKGEFNAAKQAYDKAIAALPPQNAQAYQQLQPRARAGFLLSSARIEMQADALTDASKSLEKLNDLGQIDRTRIDRLGDEIDRREKFDQIADQLAQLLEAGKLDTAERHLRQTPTRRLSKAEQQTLVDLRVELSQRRKQAFIERTIATADRLAEAGQLENAAQTLQAALNDQSSAAMQARLEALRGEQTAQATRAKAEQAADQGKLGQAIAAYQRLNELVPSQAVQSQLDKLHGKQAAAEGVELFEAGKRQQARAAFSRALGYWQDNAQARGYLTRMNAQADRQAVIDAGDQAAKQGDYATAVRQYAAAMRLEGGDNLETKLKDARMNRQLAQAKQARESGNLDKATSAYQAALRIHPQAPGAEQGLKAIATRREYNQLRDRADTLRGQGKFAKAKKRYKQAAETLETKEITQRLDQTEYEQFLAQGKAYMQAKRWKDARGALRTAARVKPTEELRDLLTTIKTHTDAEEFNDDQ